MEMRSRLYRLSPGGAVDSEPGDGWHPYTPPAGLLEVSFVLPGIRFRFLEQEGAEPLQTVVVGNNNLFLWQGKLQLALATQVRVTPGGDFSALVLARCRGAGYDLHHAIECYPASLRPTSLLIVRWEAFVRENENRFAPECDTLLQAICRQLRAEIARGP